MCKGVFFIFLCVCVCVQVLQWLIVYSDTIQSILRSQDVSMGSLQELSLLTGIISKTALPGTDHSQKFLTDVDAQV